jgi:hypothetical protein
MAARRFEPAASHRNNQTEGDAMKLIKVDNTIVNLDLMTEALFDADAQTLSIIYIAANITDDINLRSCHKFEGSAATALWRHITRLSEELFT